MKKLTTNAGGDVGEREIHFLLVGLQTGQPLTMEISVGSFPKAKNKFTI